MAKNSKMYEASFFKRMYNYGFKKFILSWDTLIAVIVFFTIFIITDGKIEKTIAEKILSNFITVSASLFGIILAGLAIVTSFTDKNFIYAWKKIGEFDNIITLFQFNLFIPIISLTFSLFLQHILYNSMLMILNIALFAYMITTLIDLVNFIVRYGLQRAEFVKQEKESRKKK